MKKDMKHLRFNKKGVVSIEAILSLTVALMIILFTFGFFTLIYPKIMLQTAVNNLAQDAKITGGLTDPSSQPVDSQLAQFDQEMQSLGYPSNQVQVTAVAEPGDINAMGVSPLGSSGTNYIHRDSGEMIYITVTLPANRSIVAPMSFFGDSGNAVPNHYVIQETVMSERW